MPVNIYGTVSASKLMTSTDNFNANALGQSVANHTTTETSAALDVSMLPT